MKGLFIVIEGPDACGKTTQIEKLKNYLSENQKEVILTREPGGTEISEKIRKLILDPKNENMKDETEALLYAASRAQHYLEKIKPAVESGKVVICDRFVHSSLVYQGYARKLGIQKVKEINDFALNGYSPDVILYFDIDYDEAQERLISRGNLDRLEKASEEFHRDIYRGYKKVFKEVSQNVEVIDARKNIEEVFNVVKKVIIGYLENR